MADGNPEKLVKDQKKKLDNAWNLVKEHQMQVGETIYI